MKKKEETAYYKNSKELKGRDLVKDILKWIDGHKAADKPVSVSNAS